VSRKSSTRVDLKKLDATKDEDIDYSDIPELGDDFFATATRVSGVRAPRKTAISVRLDTDVLEWLKAGGSGYQSRINGILRAVMAQRAASKSPKTKSVSTRSKKPTVGRTAR
jgi:uncharacterized protein (DUF4415 family)